MKFLITCKLWKPEGGGTDNQIKYELDSALSRCGLFDPQFTIGMWQVLVTTAIAY